MKKIITYITAFILMASIIALIGFVTVKNTILNKEYVISQMEKNNYYADVEKEIQSGFEEYIQQSGLEENVITELFTTEEVKEDVNIMLENIYGNEKKSIDTEKIKTRLNDKIYTSLADVSLTSTEKKSIESFIKTISNTYKDEIDHSKWLSSLNGKAYSINEKLNKISIFIYALPVILVAIIFILNIKELYRAFKAVGIAIIASGIFMLISIIFVRSNVDIENILLFNESISNLIKNVFYEILNNLTITSVVFEIVGVIVCLISNYIKILKKEQIYK